ncbi:MAG: hypothetical protein LUQ65_10610 [Candidatus Helarchaeota archaeon]|nr:hypothetical protein [Candidatus Helarchaeota archaeon]
MPFNLGTSGIGSHPLNDPKRLIRDILESGITYPYIPQLYSDEMTVQFHSMFPGIRLLKGTSILDVNTPNFKEKLDVFKDDLKFKMLLLHPHGMAVESDFVKELSVFSELLSKSPIRPHGIKCQLVGPITEAASIKIHPGNTRLIDDPELLDLLVTLTAEIAHWLSGQLLQIASSNKIQRSNVILFLDEPSLPFSIEKEIPTKEGLEKIAQVLQLIQCRKGIHICDNPVNVLNDILKIPIDLVSYDANKYSNSLKNSDRDLIEDFVLRGGGFAFGLTPNTPESVFGVERIPQIMSRELTPSEFFPTPDQLGQILHKNILPLAQKGIPIQQLLAQSLITPSCGFRNFTIPTPEEGELMVKQLLQIQEKAAANLRKTYELD